MTKQLYPAPGQIVLHCRVTSMKGRRRFVTLERGTNSVQFMSRQYNNPTVIRNAKHNARYKHLAKGGSSGSIVEVLDYEFNYYDNMVTRKRVIRFDKRTQKRRAYAEVRRTRDNKLVGRILWKTATEI